MGATVSNHRQSVWTKVEVLLPLTILVLESTTLAMADISSNTGQTNAVAHAREGQIRL